MAETRRAIEDEGPLSRRQVLEDEFQALHGRLPVGYEKERQKVRDRHGNHASQKCDEELLDAFYQSIHAEKKPLAALCLSGGGIRSATFSLGVIQGLARSGLLERFDYLSTVSGGGYIGSWLSGWIHRDPRGSHGVFEQLRSQHPCGVNPATRRKSNASGSMTREPEEVRHLREYSNYLTPRLGLLRPDSATLVVTYLRNLVLNWIVLAPLIVGLVLLPRLYVAGLFSANVRWTLPRVATIQDSPVRTSLALLTIAQLLMATAIVVPILAMPGSRRRAAKGSDRKPADRSRGAGLATRHVLMFVITPLMLSGVLLALLTAWGGSETIQKWWTGLAGNASLSEYQNAMSQPGWRSYSWFGVFVFSPMLAAILRRIFKLGAAIDLWCVGSLVFAGAIIGYISVPLMSTEPMRSFSAYPRAFTCLRVPASMLLYLVLTTLYVGFTSGRPGGDEDREWWARLMGWTLLLATLWAFAMALVVCGPMIVWNAWTPQGTPLIPSSLLVTFIAAFSGHSDSTTPRDGESPNFFKRLLFALPGIFGAVAVPLFFIFASAGVEASLQKWAGEDVIRFSAWGDFLRVGFDRSQRELNWIFILRLEFALFLLVALSGLFMNFNRFSLHAVYRDRLVRAFLGASNKRRDPDGFTGFDPEDNLPLHHLRRGRQFTHSDILDENVVDLARVLCEADSHFLRHVRNLAGQKHDLLCAEYRKSTDGSAGQQTIAAMADGAPPCSPPADLSALRGHLLCVLNAVVLDPALQSFESEFTTHTPGTCNRNETEPQTIQRARRALEADRSPILLNRLLLEDQCYAERLINGVKTRVFLLKPADGMPRLTRPFHVINMALNLVESRVLAVQQRKATSFTASPLHCGFYKGYRRSDEYGGPISLGTAMTISGAAASPNMGYHSSPAVTFLMTVFNVRLGWWLGNPASPVNQWFRKILPQILWPTELYRRSDPRNSVLPLVNEAMGRTNDRYDYVYLSDGGHFDNTGLYEMVARRCRFIILSDASCDPNHDLQDLSTAIRRVQNDMNISISMREVSVRNGTTRLRRPNEDAPYCTVGEIRYSDVDGSGARNGILIYLKPSLRSSLPVDVFNQSRVNPKFPHEPTSNQWFNDAQFESYRKLGFATVEYLKEKAAALSSPLEPREDIPLAGDIDDFDEIAQRFARAAIDEAFPRSAKRDAPNPTQTSTAQPSTAQSTTEPAPAQPSTAQSTTEPADAQASTTQRTAPVAPALVAALDGVGMTDFNSQIDRQPLAANPQMPVGNLPVGDPNGASPVEASTAGKSESKPSGKRKKPRKKS